MSDPIVCRLRLTVTARLVNGDLKWDTEIWTEGRRRHMSQGADVRNYEPEMCRVGCDSLEGYEQECEARLAGMFGRPAYQETHDEREKSTTAGAGSAALRDV